MPRSTSAGALLVVTALALHLPGCGGGEAPRGGGPPSVAGQAVTIGSLSVEVASSADLRTSVLPSPADSPFAFTVLHGSPISGLREMGYGRIAFSSEHAPNWADIYTMNLDGSDLRRLTSDTSSEDGYPAWSPDGSMIAFSRFHRGPTDEPTRILVMNADGSGLRELTSGPDSDSAPAWSPDGQTIAFGRAEDLDDRGIYLMDADGSNVRALTRPLTRLWSTTPAWSPDGRQIAFGRGFEDMYVVGADGSGAPRPLLLGGSNEGNFPSWSPDGTRMAFVAGRGSWDTVHVADVSGGPAVRLPGPPAFKWDPAWSPDGRKIAFTHSYTIDDDLSPRSISDIYVMNDDGSSCVQVTDFDAQSIHPSWCPVPTPVRSLIGPAGDDPPFGALRPLAIVGTSDRGIVSASTVHVPPEHWPSVTVEPLKGVLRGDGVSFAGVEITAPKFHNVSEDTGPGGAPRLWPLTSAPRPTELLILFSGDTGRIASVLATKDRSTSHAVVQVHSSASALGHLVLRGEFVAAWSASDPARELLGGLRAEVTLDGRTGEVLSEL